MEFFQSMLDARPYTMTS